jgi:predicted GNAT family acetyltransferase
MDLTRYDDIEQFYARAEPFLLAHEAEHNLPLGICATLRDPTQASQYAAPPYLALVSEGEAVVAAAVRTPPFRVILSLIEEERLPGALALLVPDLAAAYPDLPGVLGLTAISRAFAQQWQAETGQAYHLGMRERIYQLTAVRPPMSVPGRVRRAAEADRALLSGWMAAFFAEALPGSDEGDPGEWVARTLASTERDILVWEDGQPVSLACSGAHTPNGSRIGPVYTPPEARGHGYASACTAAVSQLQLDRGRRFCFLFTDLANPTANSIYQTIGYTPVSDVEVYEFGA